MVKLNNQEDLTNKLGHMPPKDYTESLGENLEECLEKTKAANWHKLKAKFQDKTWLKMACTGVLVVLVFGVAVVNQQLIPEAPSQTVGGKVQTIVPTVPDSKPAVDQQQAVVKPETSPGKEEPAVSTAKPTEPKEATDSKLQVAEEETHIDRGDSNDDVAVMGESIGFRLVVPETGEMTTGYGYTYDKTWQDYRFHSAIDWQLDLATPVKAMTNGKILEIVKDSGMGKIIKVDYGNQMVAWYVGLEPAADLKKGSAVTPETSLGKVTESPLFESAEKPHLHLEIWKDGVRVDPQKYF